MSIKGIVGEFDGECVLSMQYCVCCLLCHLLHCLTRLWHTVMERELEKIQKNAAAVVAHASVPDEAKREISASVEVHCWTEQSCHSYVYTVHL